MLNITEYYWILLNITDFLRFTELTVGRITESSVTDKYWQPTDKYWLHTTSVIFTDSEYNNLVYYSYSYSIRYSIIHDHFKI